MKKTAITVMAVLLTVVSMLFVSCSNDTKEPAKFTVTVVKEDGTVIDKAEVTDGEKYTLPAADKVEGYTIKSFSDGEKDDYKPGDEVVIKKDMKFTAKLEAAEHTVTFKNGDEVLKTVKVKSGEKLASSDVPADPTKDGAAFEGWETADGKKLDLTKPVTEDITVSAVWRTSENKKTVTFVYPSGDTASEAVEVADGWFVSAPAATNSNGLTIQGWYVKPSDVTLSTNNDDFYFMAGEAFDFNTAITEDTVLVAKCVFTESMFVGTWEWGAYKFELTSAKEIKIAYGNYTLTGSWAYSDTASFTINFPYQAAYMICYGLTIADTLTFTKGSGTYESWIRNSVEYKYDSDSTSEVSVFKYKADYMKSELKLTDATKTFEHTFTQYSLKNRSGDVLSTASVTGGTYSKDTADTTLTFTTTNSMAPESVKYSLTSNLFFSYDGTATKFTSAGLENHTGFDTLEKQTSGS